jgi:hypothetical protein
MDFGIAKRIEGSGSGATAATATGMVVGTPDYMSPEQAQGRKVDFRSDLYALGVMVFEMFTGRLPFQADTPVAIIMKHIQEPPPLYGEEAARLPPSLVPVLARALAKDPEARHRDTTELILDLRYAREQAPAEPGRPEAETAAATGRTGTLPTPMPTPTAVPARTQASATPATRPAPAAPTAAIASATPTVATPPTAVAPALRGRPLRLVAGVAAAVALVAVAWFARGQAPAAAPAASPAAGGTSLGQPVVLGVNALPWARVRVSPLGAVAAAARPEPVRTTPCAFALVPGEYLVELENGGLTPPLRQKIQVPTATPGDLVFTMPGYDPDAVAAAAVARP